MVMSNGAQVEILPGKWVSIGAVIPKPDARADFIVKGVGKTRGEAALVYTIPNHSNPDKPHQKRISSSDWEAAYHQICSTGEFSRRWFDQNMTACAKDGACNFTTIGGLFELLGFAKHTRGTYLHLQLSK